MRCEIGCRSCMTTPGHRGELLAQRGEERLLGAIGLGASRTSISAALTSCACSSSSARPVRRAVETTSGNDEQDLLDAPAEPIGLLERGPGQRDGVDGQRALVELGQERAAEERRPARAATGEQRRPRRRSTAIGAAHRADEQRPIAALEAPHDEAARRARALREPRQDVRAQRRASPSARRRARRRSRRGTRSRAARAAGPRRRTGRTAARRRA